MTQTRIILKPAGAAIIVVTIASLSMFALGQKWILQGGQLPEAGTNVPGALVNGSMEEGKNTPDGWKIVYQGEGAVSLHRDTETKKEGKASLRLQSDGNTPAYGTAGQPLSITEGQAWHVQGWMRATGDIKEAYVAIRYTEGSDSGKQTGWENLGVLQGATADGTWQFFKKTLVPSAGNVANLQILLSGSGKLWVDGLEVKAIPPSPVSPASPATP